MNPFSKPWTDLPINTAEPLMMHIDMNSCFATMEQQANPLLRGRPIAVAAYDAPYGCVIAPSIEAKLLGIKVGMRVKDVKQICPEIVIIQSNPPLYRDAHMRFKRIFEDYSDKVIPKSIDEAVIDFHGTEPIRKGKSLVDIGHEIKLRVHDEIGEWVRVNVGISTNRFLAKTAAGLHKPDGLDVITKDNLLDVYAGMDRLIDITGINVRYEARLMQNGIKTPLQFFKAPVQLLKKQVFKSITGYYWYVQLRGYDLMNYETERKSIGHDWTVQSYNPSPELIRQAMMKLCEKTGRRLRRNDYYAEGIHVWAAYRDHTFWHEGHKVHARLYTTEQIFKYAMELFGKRPRKLLAKMGISVYGLQPTLPEQLGLFDGEKGDKNKLSLSLDRVNDRYGDMVVGSALLMNMDNFILDRVAFCSVRDMQELYSKDYM